MNLLFWTEIQQMSHYSSLWQTGNAYEKKLKLILKFMQQIGKLVPVYGQSFFCSAVLTRSTTPSTLLLDSPSPEGS